MGKAKKQRAARTGGPPRERRRGMLRGRKSGPCPLCGADAPLYAVGIRKSGAIEFHADTDGWYWDEHPDGAGRVCQSAGEKEER